MPRLFMKSLNSFTCFPRKSCQICMEETDVRAHSYKNPTPNQTELTVTVL